LKRSRRAKGLFELAGKVYRKEAIGSVGIVFTAFVNDAEVAVRGGGFVGDKAIDFSALERGGVIFVVNSDGEFWGAGGFGFAGHWDFFEEDYEHEYDYEIRIEGKWGDFFRR